LSAQRIVSRENRGSIENWLQRRGNGFRKPGNGIERRRRCGEPLSIKDSLYLSLLVTRVRLADHSKATLSASKLASTANLLEAGSVPHLLSDAGGRQKKQNRRKKKKKNQIYPKERIKFYGREKYCILY
jgi:hypothetical protein